MRLIRGLIDSVVEGAIKRLTGRGVAGETLSNREYFQHYGLTSRPLEGAEYVAIKDGNNIIIVASDDRQYRLALEEGEVALYDYQGQAVHLKKDNKMGIVCTGELTMQATTLIRFEAPNIQASGAFSSETSVADPNGTMQAMRDVYNQHTQPVVDGTANAPTQQM